jgi:hypothetical protein
VNLRKAPCRKDRDQNSEVLEGWGKGRGEKKEKGDTMHGEEEKQNKKYGQLSLSSLEREKKVIHPRK